MSTASGLKHHHKYYDGERDAGRGAGTRQPAAERGEKGFGGRKDPGKKTRGLERGGEGPL